MTTTADALKIRAMARAKFVAKVERNFIQDCAFRNDRVGHNLKFELTHRPISTMFEDFKSPVLAREKFPIIAGL
jgi:hypothetical protein